MKVRVIEKYYYNDRVYKPGAIIEFSGNRLPSCVEPLNPDPGQVEEETDANKNKPPEPTTLHEMAEKKTVKVSKPGKRATGRRLKSRKEIEPISLEEVVVTDNPKGGINA